MFIADVHCQTWETTLLYREDTEYWLSRLIWDPVCSATPFLSEPVKPTNTVRLQSWPAQSSSDAARSPRMLF